MIHNDIENLYFNWLMELAFPNKEFQERYHSLLNQLYSAQFMWDKQTPLDENRYIDGVDLRTSFAYRLKIPQEVVDECIQGPCSILEMVCALGVRIDNDIMANYYTGDDHGYFWIQKMLKNLDLLQYDDLHWDFAVVELKLNNFLNKNYSKEGFGGLFYIPNSEKDMRSLNIWDQMCYYICKNYYEKET